LRDEQHDDYYEVGGESAAVYKPTVKPSVPRKPVAGGSSVSSMAARYNNATGQVNTEIKRNF
jgi:hypothetical protein